MRAITQWNYTCGTIHSRATRINDSNKWLVIGLPVSAQDYTRLDQIRICIIARILFIWHNVMLMEEKGIVLQSCRTMTVTRARVLHWMFISPPRRTLHGLIGPALFLRCITNSVVTAFISHLFFWFVFVFLFQSDQCEPWTFTARMR